MYKEWKNKGLKTRDWVKNKVIFFDEQKKPQAMNADEYRQYQKQKYKD